LAIPLLPNSFSIALTPGSFIIAPMSILHTIIAFNASVLSPRSDVVSDNRPDNVVSDNAVPDNAVPDDTSDAGSQNNNSPVAVISNPPDDNDDGAPDDNDDDAPDDTNDDDHDDHASVGNDNLMSLPEAAGHDSPDDNSPDDNAPVDVNIPADSDVKVDIAVIAVEVDSDIENASDVALVDSDAAYELAKAIPDNALDAPVLKL
jgi:hypothetical protein